MQWADLNKLMNSQQVFLDAWGEHTNPGVVVLLFAGSERGDFCSCEKNRQQRGNQPLSSIRRLSGALPMILCAAIQ